MRSKNKKLALLGITAISSLAIGVFAVSGIATDAFAYNYNSKNVLENRITLDSSNKVSSAGDHIQKTAKGNDIVFTYTSVSSSTGHTQLNSGGSIVNKTQITSIESLTANFSGAGSLKARIAYVPGTWAEYFSLVSGAKVEFASKPYYLELKADGGSINLESANYTFSCNVNPDAEPHEDVGSYDIVFKTNGSDGGTVLNTTDLFKGQITSGAEYVSELSYGYYIYSGKNGLKISSSSSDGYFLFTLNKTLMTKTITSIIIHSSEYDSGIQIRLFANDGEECTGKVSAATGGTIAIEEDLTSVYLDTSSKRAYISSISFNYDDTYIPGAPENPTAYEVGFTATDANKDKYTTNSIFDENNGLSVVSNKSDATTSPVSSSDYSYVVKDSNGNNINTSAKFPAEGVYTLVVSYGNYIPQEISLTVGEYIYIVDVTMSLTKTTYTTADTFSNYLSSNLTASITLSNQDVISDISYSEFAEKGIGLKLIRNNVSVDYTKPFGTTGLWKARVYSLEFENDVYYDVDLTINAIPVESITLNQTSYTLYPEGQLQLTASVYPTDATNDNVNWTSEDESIATVIDNGDGSATVTAIAVGGTTINATAADGTGVYGSCVITVTPKPAEPEWAKVTDASSIQNGDVIAITYESSTKTVELAGFSNTSTIYGTDESYSTKPAGLYSLTVVDGSGDNYALKNGNNYLCWNTGNSLQTSTSITDNSSWTFSGTSLITNVSDSSRKILYNTNSPRFACYTGTSSQVKDITIYKQTNAAPVTPVYPTSITLTGNNSISIGDTTQLTVGYSEGTNVKNVTFTSSNSNVAGVSNTGLVTGVSEGSATITATAEAANSTTVTATLSVTVNSIAVTSISLDAVSTSVKAGKTVTLIATVYPSNATNKTVKWLSSATSVATVSSSGVVTGIAAGNATITAYSDTNGNNTCDTNEKKATCVVTVTTSSGEEEFSITYNDLPSAYETGDTVYTASSGIKFQAYNCAGGYSSKMQFKGSSGYLQTTEALELQSITINDRESNTLTVYGSNTAGSFNTEINGSNDVYDLTGYSYFKIARNSSGAGYCSSVTVVTGTPTPTDPTSIVLSPTTAEVGIGGFKQLSVSYIPSNANQNKEITWSSSNTNVATVNNEGYVSVKTTASAGQTATITAKLTNLPSITATCKITVIEQKKDDHTVLIYICGADLESKNNFASGDIAEILKVSGQPDDVNIVIETGGANSWSSTYGISSSKLERWHVENKSLVRDDSLTYASMGLTSTLQSFIEYGLNNYPAERTGLVLWNHGGAMHGVCYDEKKDDDSLLNNEVKSAVSGAMSNCGLAGQKLEWIGYDACLMQVQDIAEFNSQYFNYMVASEESEAGEGWDYDTWVDDLYAKKPTTTILKAIVDGFISDNGGKSSSSDQTLSYLTLSYMSAYKTAWENLATQLDSKLTSSNKSSFTSAITSKVKHFGDSDYDYFCTFDAKDFINKLVSDSSFSSFRVDSSYTTAVLNAFSNLVTYSVAQRGAGNSYGLCMVWLNNSTYSYKSMYSTNQTNFTKWRQLNIDYGTYANK